MKSKNPKDYQSKFSKEKLRWVKKRDGTITAFDQSKITDAIFKAITATAQGDGRKAKRISDRVVEILKRRFKKDEIPQVEQIQDIVEEVLILENLVETAKAYILYREQRRRIREAVAVVDESTEMVDRYLNELDWQVYENANMTFSLQGLNQYAIKEVAKKYWLNKIYPKEIREAAINEDFHIHNLETIACYCMGWDLYDLLIRGFGGVPSKIESRPAKHFRTALGQLVNFFFTLQGECYSRDTQVLTESGWKYFYEVKRNDKVFTLNNQTNEIELQEPIRFYEFDYDGELYNFKSKKLDLLVTPKHNMLVRQYYPGKKEYQAKFVKAKDFHPNTHFIPKNSIWRGRKIKWFVLPGITIFQYRNFNPPQDPIIFPLNNPQLTFAEKANSVQESFSKIFSLPTNTVLAPQPLREHEIKQIEPKKILMDNWLKFFGFWLTEGCTALRKRKKKGDKNSYYEYQVRISQKKSKRADDFEQILKKLPFRYIKKQKRKKREFIILNRQLFFYLRQFGDEETKFIPKKIKNLSKEQLKILFDWMIKGNGYNDNGNIDYYTKSKRLADDFQEIVLKLGWSANIYEKYKGKFKWYRIGVSRRKHFKFRQGNIQKLKYQGKVYCLEVPNHTLYVRREGKACWCGNSAGAQAVSNFDTLLAPFIRYDRLNYLEVKQAMQEFLYNCMVPTRTGFQTPFINVSLDIKVPDFYKNQPVIIGGKPQKETYSEFQEEMSMFIRAFYETLMEGDAKGRPMTFPIPTVSITKDFDWHDPNLNPLWEATAKYGVNYFSNFIQSDMKPEDYRSMCCRLRLSNKELYKRGGGLFGSSPLTGCYDKKTEILTENGWKFFKDLTKEDKVFTLTKDNEIELHHPTKIFKYDYKGKMIHFKAKSIDLLVTPNHRMVVDYVYKNKRKFVEAKDFDCNNYRIPKQGIWKGKEEEYFILPPVIIMNRRGFVFTFSDQKLESIRKIRREEKSIYQIAENFNCQPVTIHNICPRVIDDNCQRIKARYEVKPLKIKMDDWLKFFGFWLAEGSTGNENIDGYPVIISQSDKERKEEVKRVLDVLPFNYSEKGNNLIIYNKQLWVYLQQFGNKHQRFIPKEIKNLSRRQLRILFDWLVKGGGRIRKTTGQINYWTFSKKLADDLQEIILKLGWLGALYIQKKKTNQINGRIIKTGIVYNIRVQKAKHYRLRKRNIKEVYLNGKVYCCEVKNHTVFVRRNGKVSWCGNSIGVVTINLPRIGYLSKTKKEFFKRLSYLMDLAKESLEIKRKALENFMEKGLYPYSRYYLTPVKKLRGCYFGNHFSTIGLMGMNEALLNFIGETTATIRGRRFTLEVLDFMRDRLVKYQKETGNLYNLEATPGEGTSFRQAKADKERYPDIITAGTKETPYYTNSSHLPVNFTDDAFEALKLQDECQCRYTGGTVLHLFLGERLSDPQSAKNLVKKIFENFRLPYITLTPTFSICPNHGYLEGEHFECPKCTIKQPCEVYSRIVGYLRPVSQWNEGKREEFRWRREYRNYKEKRITSLPKEKIPGLRR